MIRTYPRLPTAAATRLLTELTAEASQDGINGLRRLASTRHPMAVPYPTAAPQSDEQISRVGDSMRKVAEEFGYPASLRGRSDSERARAFDQTASRELLEVLDIAPVDAAQEGVWSFISLVVLPDVAFWRWPNVRDRADYERLIGRPRNVFRRLWWRAYCLGPDTSAALLEDEAVSIMERPAIGGDPRVAHTVAERQLAAVRANPDLPRMEMMRQVAKRFRRFTSFVTLPALSDDQLTALVDEIYVVVLANLPRSGG